MITLHAKNVPHTIKSTFEERASRYMLRTFDPFNILRAWENKVDPDRKAEWEMIVAVTKARMSGHFDAEVIRDAEIEVR